MYAPHFWAIGIMLRSRVACNPFIRHFVLIFFLLLFEFNYPAVDSAVLKIPVQVVNSSNKMATPPWQQIAAQKRDERAQKIPEK